MSSFLEGDVQQNREDEIYACEQAPRNFVQNTEIQHPLLLILRRTIFLDSPQIGGTQEEYRTILLKAVETIYTVQLFLF